MRRTSPRRPNRAWCAPNPGVKRMLQKPKCPIIALEEHYADDELIATYTGADVNPVPAIVTRLRDVGEERLKAMDADGIDMQVLSHTAPSTQKLGPDVAVDFARPGHRRLARLDQAAPAALRGLRGAAAQHPRRGRRRARPHRHRARLQGRDDPRAGERRLARRQTQLAGPRPRREARRPDLPASIDA